MAKLDLENVESGYQSATLQNANNDRIEAEFDKVLYRNDDSGDTSPLSQNIDMNSNKIINLAEGTQNSQAVNLAQMNTAIATGVLQGSIEDADIVPTVAALKAIEVSTLTTGHTAITQGYTTLDDGGASTYYFDSTSSATDDGGAVIQPAVGSGRWILLLPYAVVNSMQFGAVGDDSTDDTSKFNAAIDYLVTLGGGTLIVPANKTFIISDDISNDVTKDTGIRLFDNIEILGTDRATSILKMQDGALDNAHVLRAAAGPSIPWNLTRVENVKISNLTIDGNRANHSRTTLTDGVTTQGSAILTSASAPFIADHGISNWVAYVDRNKSRYAITDISAATQAVVTAIGHDFRAGDIALITNMTGGTGNIGGLNNQSSTIVAITTDILGVNQSYTININTVGDSYGSGGFANAGLLDVKMSNVTSTQVTLSQPAIASTSENGVILELGENGWGIELSGADNVTIRDVTIKNCWGDGIYIDSPFGGTTKLAGSTNITIDNVDCDTNRRNGISIISGEHINITNSYFRNSGINGRGPGAGIDVEPDTDRCRDIFINNCHFLDNQGPGFTSAIIFADTSGTPLVLNSADKYGTWNVNVTNSVMRGNRNHGISITGVNEGCIIDGCKVDQNKVGGIRIRGNATGKVQGQVKILNCYVGFNQWYKGTVGSSDPDDNRNGHGIIMANSSNPILMHSTLIQGCSIEYNDGHGIFSSGLVNDYLNIYNNASIIGNGQELDNTYSNIKVEGTQSVGLQIIGNKIEKGATASDVHPYGVSTFKLSRYGIEVNSTGTYTTIVSRNNVQTGGSTANIVGLFGNSIDGNRNTLFGNIGYKTEATVVSVALDSDTLGDRSTTIAHGLAITPLINTVTISIADDIGGTPISTTPTFKMAPYISAVDATNITVKWNISVSGVGFFIINARVMSDSVD